MIVTKNEYWKIYIVTLKVDGSITSFSQKRNNLS